MIDEEGMDGCMEGCDKTRDNEWTATATLFRPSSNPLSRCRAWHGMAFSFCHLQPASSAPGCSLRGGDRPSPLTAPEEQGLPAVVPASVGEVENANRNRAGVLQVLRRG
jgi:hypothetical protein